MSCPNKGKACFCTGECHQKDTQGNVLYRSDRIDFVTPIKFSSGQEVLNTGHNSRCEFLAYDPSDNEFCYIRYGLYNVQRVKVKDLEGIVING